MPFRPRPLKKFQLICVVVQKAWHVYSESVLHVTNLPIPYLPFSGDEAVIYEKWIKKKEGTPSQGKERVLFRVVKEAVESTLVNLVDEFEAEIRKFMYHEGTVMHQFREVDRLKKRLACSK